MPKATVTVESEDGSISTREMSWTKGETPNVEDWSWLHANIAKTNEESK